MPGLRAIGRTIQTRKSEGSRLRDRVESRAVLDRVRGSLTFLDLGENEQTSPGMSPCQRRMGAGGMEGMAQYLLQLRGSKVEDETHIYHATIQRAGNGDGVVVAGTRTLEKADEEKMLAVSDRIRNDIDAIRGDGCEFPDMELTDEQAQFFGWVG
jgi:hypothetical protein